MNISTAFDSGSVDIVSLERADDIQLKIRKDSQSDFLQWFHFRLQGAAGENCRIRFLNAGETSYVKGWEDGCISGTACRASQLCVTRKPETKKKILTPRAPKFVSGMIRHSGSCVQRPVSAKRAAIVERYFKASPKFARQRNAPGAFPREPWRGSGAGSSRVNR